MATTIKKVLGSRLEGASKIAVLGIGSDLRGDDAAGMIVADRIDKLHKSAKLKVFKGSTAPENLTGEIKRFKPSHLIIVDTVEFKGKPGTIFVLNPEDFGDGVSFTTHKMPARVLIQYFNKSFKSSITLVGIQPKSVKFSGKISIAVKESAKEVADAIISAAKGKVK